MDKCILSDKDIKSLLEWRDRNKHLVRRNCRPIKGIEIVFSESNGRIKYVRDDKYLKIHYVDALNQSFNCVIDDSMNNGGYKIIKAPSKGVGSDVILIDTVCTLYFALMALIVYGDDIEYTKEELDVIDDLVKRENNDILSQKDVKKKVVKRDNIIYLFNKDTKGRLSLRRKGRHNSPHGQFNVRGHFRHYKNGKVSWIKEYKKGVGKKKNKIYRL